MAINRYRNRSEQFSPRGRLRYNPFFPHLISDCVLWVHGAAGITLNGTDVSAWADQSGAGNDLSQGTADRQPGFTASVAALNGQPAVQFTEADGNMIGTAEIDYDQPLQFFIVCKRDSDTDAGNIILGGAGASEPSFEHDGTDEQVVMGKAVVTAANTDTTNWQIRDYFLDGASATTTIWKNGTVTHGPGGTGQKDFTYLCLGDYNTNAAANDYFDGAIAEVIIYDRELTAIERKQVESYLGDKYGIAVA